VRDSDTVARMGGDEFTVLLPGISSPQNAALITQKILSRIIEPVTLEHQEVFISSSIGIALFPEDATNTERLMHNAERLSLHARLRRAIDAREFFLEYQPQIDAWNGRLVGIESLIRWRNGGNKVIYPNDFIPRAEENGLIHEIGDFVLREACNQGLR
jgi:predicted signal transduction protein with EAL and GGDEF domain